LPKISVGLSVTVKMVRAPSDKDRLQPI